MAHNFDRSTQLSEGAQAALVDELDLRYPADTGPARRLSFRHTHMTVTVRPANVAERDRHVTTVHASEISSHSMVGMATRPAMVGNYFRLDFEQDDIGIDATVAVCDRCTMLADTSFELRFRFAQEIALPEAAEHEERSTAPQSSAKPEGS